MARPLSMTLMFMWVLFAAAAPAHAGMLEDCLAESMRGVGSDEAARTLRQICINKHKAYVQARREKLLEEYGPQTDQGILELLSGPYDSGKARFREMEILNRSTELTVTFVRLRIGPPPCDWNNAASYTYEVKLKPGQRKWFKFPFNGQRDECIWFESPNARPPTWADISVSSKVQPTARNPFDETDW